MSIVVYGPQGCGKGLHAEELRKAFRLAYIVHDAIDVYRRWGPDLKARRALFLTHEEPPKDHGETRRFIPFDRALAMARKATRGTP